MKKLLLLGILFCSLSLVSATNKEEETPEEDIKAEGTYFGDDSVKTSSKVKTGARLAAAGVAATAAAGGIIAGTIAASPGFVAVGAATGALMAAELAIFGAIIAPTAVAVTPLEIAIAEDNFKAVQKILNKNPKAAGLTFKDRLPLHFATIRNTDLDIINLLITTYPNALQVKNSNGCIPIIYAIKNKYSSTKASVKKLFGFKYEDTENHKVFDALLKAYPKCVSMKLGIIKNLITKNEPIEFTLFHKAALVDDPYYLQELLKINKNGAKDTSKHGFLPLHLAATRSNKEIIKILLKLYPEAVNIKDNYGKTPIDLARNDEIKIMLGAKKEVSFFDKVKGTLSSETTTLHIAARKGDETTIKKILAKEPNAAVMPDKDGNIPLHLAAQRKDGANTVKMLLKAYEKGASMKNKDGQTPDDLAATEEIKDLLLKVLL